MGVWESLTVSIFLERQSNSLHIPCSIVSLTAQIVLLRQYRLLNHPCQQGVIKRCNSSLLTVITACCCSCAAVPPLSYSWKKVVNENEDHRIISLWKILASGSIWGTFRWSISMPLLRITPFDQFWSSVRIIAKQSKLTVCSLDAKTEYWWMLRCSTNPDTNGKEGHRTMDKFRVWNISETRQKYFGDHVFPSDCAPLGSLLFYWWNCVQQSRLIRSNG